MRGKYSGLLTRTFFLLSDEMTLLPAILRPLGALPLAALWLGSCGSGDSGPTPVADLLTSAQTADGRYISWEEHLVDPHLPRTLARSLARAGLLELAGPENVYADLAGALRGIRDEAAVGKE